MDRLKQFRIISPLLLTVLGLGLLCFGLLRGEGMAVLTKAVNICLECVGIG